MEKYIQNGILNVVKGVNMFIYGSLKSINYNIIEPVGIKSNVLISKTANNLLSSKMIRNDYKKIGEDMRVAIRKYREA